MRPRRDRKFPLQLSGRLYRLSLTDIFHDDNVSSFRVVIQVLDDLNGARTGCSLSILKSSSACVQDTRAVFDNKQRQLLQTMQT